jgi:hypothetical protein
MCSDSQGTEGADDTRREVEKMWADGGLLFGYSGYGAIKEPLVVSVSGALANIGTLTRWEARDLLAQAIKPVLENAYRNFVPAGPGENFGMLKGALLVIGHDSNGYWLLELDGNNIASFYTEPGFHAIGSGSVAAQVASGLLQHYEPGGRSVAHLKLLASRTVETCISVLGGRWGVGGRPLMWFSESGGPFAKASEDELAAIANAVGGWVLIETESLNKAFPEGPGGLEDTIDERPPEPPTKG